MEKLLFFALLFLLRHQIKKQAFIQRLKPQIMADLSVRPYGNQELANKLFPRKWYAWPIVYSALMQLEYSELIRHYESPGLAEEKGNRLVTLTLKGRKLLEGKHYESRDANNWPGGPSNV